MRRPDGVFVSSVYDELKDYRKAALDAVWHARLYPIGMEREKIARPTTTVDASRSMLDESSVYVGIFAQRYGRVTIEELRYAQELGLPILAFFADKQLNTDDVEPDPGRVQDLDAIKQELREKHTVASFSDAAELGIEVLRSLLTLRDEGKLAASEASQAPLEQVPTPPEPYYAHPYIGGSRFVGRKNELGLLDAWATSADPTLIVEAIGGSGKSALTWEWVHIHLPTALPDRTGLVWWSFYESQATIGKFLSHTLAYLTNRSVESCAKLPRNVQEEQLLTVLRTKPVVLVLDGVERLLLAYHRHDAAHLADAVVEEEPRRCTDPRDGTLLRRLSQGGPSKVLITSRLVPQDLQTRVGGLLSGVRHIPLLGLSGEDAVALLQELGVSGDATLMRSFLAEFGDHALLIQVLAGRIRAYKPVPGNFDAWYQVVGRRLELREQMLVSRQASILEAALEDLDPAVFKLLSQLAAFRYPVDYDAVVAINPFRPAGEDDREFGLEPLHQALSTLEERGLVQWDRVNNRYDLHPIVRAYAYGRLEDREATYAQVKNYFEALPEEDEDKVRDVADLRRTLELYHALLNSGQLDAALQLYRDRLDVLYYGLGTYTTMVELLSPLFTKSFDQPPTLQNLNDQAYAANDLALAFDNLGDYIQAQRLYAMQNRLHLQERDASNLAYALDNFGSSLMDAGQLAAAKRAFQLSLAIGQAVHMQVPFDEAHGFLVDFYSTTGDWTQGDATYAVLQASPDDAVKTQPFTFIFAARLLWGQGQDPTPLLAEALRREHEDRFLFAQREAQQLAGEVAFAHGDLSQAKDVWQEAYTIAQREGAPLGHYLAALARVHAAQQDGEQAKALIGEALAQGGQHVALAAVEVYTALSEPAEAKRYVDTAYREAWADGPPYAFYFELQRIRAALKTLGLPEPQLPPFDPARIPPLPDEAEIRAFIEELKREQGDDANDVIDANNDEDAEDATQDGMLALTPEIEPANPAEAATPISQNGRHPWWKFWSQN
jgi:tetratricopeptide (TPR) repeat protein